MVRYCKQRDHYSCGPLAILNLLKHLGYAYTYKDMPKLRRKLKTSRRGGTWICHLDHFIRKQFKIKKVCAQANLSTIQEWVSQEYPVVVNWRRYVKKEKRWRAHVILVLKVTKYYIYGVNLFTNSPAYTKVAKHGFRRRYYSRSHYRNKFLPTAWIINEKANTTSN